MSVRLILAAARGNQHAYACFLKSPKKADLGTGWM
jgi:hypothetical protein